MHNREEMRPIGGGKVALSGKEREVKLVYLMGMTRRIPITCIFFMALSVVLSAVWAGAQLTDTGTIVGTVQDQSGTAIPVPKVTVINQATNVQQMTTTNARGEYVVPSLKVGTYSVTVEMSGFQTFVRSGIIVDVQSRVAVDVTMQVGAMTQKVEVTGAPPLLDTQNANEGHLMATQGVVDLPLNGRQYSQLALLTAGVFQRPSGFLGSSVFAGDGYFNVNGNTSFQNNFILDGVDNNSFIENFQGRSAQAAQPPPDALAEFKLQTRTYDPEFGRSAGGVINTQIKSGTNSLHGDAWEFLRNSSLDANDFFLNRAGLKKPEFQQNQFGGTLGGPIVRDKAFFFGAYEGTRIRKGVSFVGNVPTPLMRQFNFSELATPPQSPTLAGLSQFSGCITHAILNPACVDPVAAKVFNLYPLPNTNVGKEGIPGGFTGNNFTSSGKSIDNENNGIVRTDQKIGERDSLFEHFTIFRISLVAPSIFSSVNPIADGAEGQSNFDIRNYNGALGWTHVFNPTTVLDLRAGFNRKFSNGTQFLLGQDVNAQFGLKGIPNFPGVSGGLPDFETISGFNKLGGLAWTPQTQISQVWQFRGILTKIKGAHTIKVGFEWSRNANSYLDVFANRGFFSFSGQYTGQGITDLLLGTPNFVGLTSLTFPHQFADARNLFVQDTWRVTPKLTVNYGLREPPADHWLVARYARGTVSVARSRPAR